jgi:hypothetical protein
MQDRGDFSLWSFFFIKWINEIFSGECPLVVADSSSRPPKNCLDSHRFLSFKVPKLAAISPWFLQFSSVHPILSGITNLTPQTPFQNPPHRQKNTKTQTPFPKEAKTSNKKIVFLFEVIPFLYFYIPSF